ncbi:MAG TPA: MFS transporter [Afifellaceae bacterium]|nr:MFS transporter [Afifellaceae bacterium]
MALRSPPLRLYGVPDLPQQAVTGTALASQLLPIAALLASTAFLLIANGLHGLLLPVRGTLEGFSTTEIGLIGAGWAAGFVLGCLYAPHLVQRAGHVRAFGAAAAAAAIVVLLNGMVVAPWPWIGLRVLSGFALAMAFMIIESWLNERASNESRGTIFAVYMTVTYLGLTVGQLLLVTAEVGSTTLFMLVGIFFSLAVLPTALSKAASPLPLTRVSLNLPRLVENSPIAAFTILMVGVVNGAFGALAPVFAAAVGLPTSLIAVMMAAAIVAGALAQLPVGRLSDHFDRRHVLAASALGAALAGLAIFVFVPGGATLVMLTAAYGTFAYVLYSLAVAHANDFAAPEDFVAVSGGLLLLYGIGTMVGPVAASYVMQAVRPGALFALTAVSHLAIAGYAIYRATRRPPAPEAEREAFAVVPVSRALTPQTAALDPRGEAAAEEEAEMEAAEAEAVGERKL